MFTQSQSDLAAKLLEDAKHLVTSIAEGLQKCGYDAEDELSVRAANLENALEQFRTAVAGDSASE